MDRQIEEKLESIGMLQMSALEARVFIEQVLENGYDHVEKVYTALFGACWQLLNENKPEDPEIPDWRNVFLKATVLYRGMNEQVMAQKTLVFADMMAISMQAASRRL